jgi:hypothetical protein
MEPDPTLDELAERLASLPENDRQHVVRKATERDVTEKQRRAADAVKAFLTGTHYES